MNQLTAEVISIGDEMTSGARLDTNSQWLSVRLGELGIRVTHHTTVGDTLADNVAALQIATDRADVVVCTGGLGPTQDDLTRQAMADLVGQPLELRESSLRHIESMFAQRKRPMPPRNRVQAMFPVSAAEIFNPQGTAPGVDMVRPRPGRSSSRIFALPGVPAEMKSMFDATVASRLMEQVGGGSVIRHHVMRLFGTGESDMEALLGDMISRTRSPRVGITVSAATISLRITATATTEHECRRQIDATRDEIMSVAGQYHFGDGEDFEQYHAISESFSASGRSLMVVEFGYAAPLGDWFATLGDTPAYRGGLSLARRDDLKRLTATDDITAAASMLLERFEATDLLMVDAYPSIVPGDDRPMPAADVDLIVVRRCGQVHRTDVSLGGHPSIVHPRIGKAALAWLRGIPDRD